MPYEDCKSRLMDYFGNITYIDDTFDRCLVEDRQPLPEDENKSGPPLPLPGDPESFPDSDGAVEVAGANNSAVNLLSLLEAMNQEKYKRIHLHPVLYTGNTLVNQLCEKIKAAPLTIIDWNLGETTTAFSIVDELLETTKQLKVIVVYTASYNDAIKDLEGKEAEKYQLIRKEEESNISCYRLNMQSLLVVAEKSKYDILALIDKVSDCFIDFYGVMPLALLDYMESIQQLSDSLISSFCNPFDALYMLQMYYSETSEDEIPNLLTSFILNRIQSECTVNSTIVEEMLQWNRERLYAFVIQDNASSTRLLNSILDNMKAKLSKSQKPIIEAIRQCGCEELKKCCSSLAEDHSGWYIDTKKMPDYLKMIKNTTIDNQVNKVMACKNSLFDDPERKAVISEIRQRIKRMIESHSNQLIETALSQLLPLLIQILITRDMKIPSGHELISNMKVKKYQDLLLKDQLSITEDIPVEKREEFFFNKIHFGDILSKTTDDSTMEFLLCMTAPCDAFRPSKTECNYTFIRGKIVEKNALTNPRKESFHITVLPSFEDEESVVYVGWKLYDIVQFNLMNDIDLKKLCSYKRPFIMAEPYARQISSKLTAYYARAGVDELFIKSEENLRSIFC